MKKIIQILLLIIVLSCSKEEVVNDSINIPSSEDPSYTLWSGNIKTFTKNDDVDPNIAENQDRLTPNVWITRDNDGGRYIILQKKVLQINQIALLEQNGQLGV